MNRERRSSNTGVIETDIDFAQLFDRFSHHFLYLSFLSDIGFDGYGAVLLFAQKLHCFCQLSAIAADAGNIGPVFPHRLGKCPSQAAAGSGNQGYLTGKVKYPLISHFFSPSSFLIPGLLYHFARSRDITLSRGFFCFSLARFKARS
jgi:hypothetical protein